MIKPWTITILDYISQILTNRIITPFNYLFKFLMNYFFTPNWKVELSEHRGVMGWASSKLGRIQPTLGNAWALKLNSINKWIEFEFSGLKLEVQPRKYLLSY